MKPPARRQTGSRPPHPHAWIWEPLESDPSFSRRAMFGSQAVYLNGKLMFCCFAQEGPWQGLLLATDRQHHPSLMDQYPSLTPHSVLGKWLYLSESADDFESTARSLVRLVEQLDLRIGVLPSPKKRKRS